MAKSKLNVDQQLVAIQKLAASLAAARNDKVISNLIAERSPDLQRILLELAGILTDANSFKILGGHDDTKGMVLCCYIGVFGRRECKPMSQDDCNLIGGDPSPLKEPYPKPEP
jgi:hypothetical protein